MTPEQRAINEAVRQWCVLRAQDGRSWGLSALREYVAATTEASNAQGVVAALVAMPAHVCRVRVTWGKRPTYTCEPPARPGRQAELFGGDR